MELTKNIYAVSHLKLRYLGPDGVGITSRTTSMSSPYNSTLAVGALCY